MLGKQCTCNGNPDCPRCQGWDTFDSSRLTPTSYPQGPQKADFSSKQRKSANSRDGTVQAPQRLRRREAIKTWRRKVAPPGATTLKQTTSPVMQSQSKLPVKRNNALAHNTGIVAAPSKVCLPISAQGENKLWSAKKSQTDCMARPVGPRDKREGVRTEQSGHEGRSARAKSIEPKARTQELSISVKKPASTCQTRLQARCLLPNRKCELITRNGLPVKPSPIILYLLFGRDHQRL
jgi:hypothetical protein